MRVERDKIGAKEIPANSFYGIHSLRAKENFPGNSQFSLEWYKALGVTKLACYKTYKKYCKAVAQNFPEMVEKLNFFSVDITDALINSAEEIAEGNYFDDFIVPANQGGAGTSINMNLNEIITNLSLQKIGDIAGNYNRIDPIENANVFQSTNDVVPTALKVAVLRLLSKLEESVNDLRKKVEVLEKEHQSVLRLAYTQMQEAVPSSFGMLFSSWNNALSRDWWRISKCFERIKQVNLGGSAVGTGITVPRFFLMEVVGELKRLTNLPITRSENLSDTTQNLDSFVEIHAILKSYAVNLEKISSDIRLLSADAGIKTLRIKKLQTGSSIMPGKVNPVITEFVVGSVAKVFANDQLISNLAAKGQLDLNPYLPFIGHALIESIEILNSLSITISNNLIEGISINEDLSRNKLYNSSAITTALVPFIGYNRSAEIADFMKENKVDVFEANKTIKLVDNEVLRKILSDSQLLKLGYTVADVKQIMNFPDLD